MNGKVKGSGFERTVCRKLSKWVTGSENPECFWRSGGSGSMATVSHSSQSGDIVALQHKHHMDQFELTRLFILECKSYKDFRFDFMIDSKYDKSNIAKWWMKLIDECADKGKMPMLIIKKNRSPIYIAMHNNIIKLLERWMPYSMHNMNFIKNREMFVIRMDHLFACVPYHAFIETSMRDANFITNSKRSNNIVTLLGGI